jgi:hypothetical protein
MATFIIADETVHAAFTTLQDAIGPAAAARAMRERREDERRAAKAKAFLAATGTAGERESRSIIDPDYITASERFYEAIEADEYHRNERNKCEAIIECWRTCQSNFRAMGKVG